MVDTTKLGLPILAASQAQKHVTMNESLYRLDTLVQLSVLDKDLTAPPASPTEGDSYIVGASATGAWSGHDEKVAAFTTGIWFFHIPKAGWLSWVADEDAYYSYDGSAWAEFESGGGGGDALPLTGGELTGNLTVKTMTPTLTVSSPDTTSGHALYRSIGRRTIGSTGVIGQHDYINNVDGSTVSQWLLKANGDVDLTVGVLKVSSNEVYHAGNFANGSDNRRIGQLGLGGATADTTNVLSMNGSAALFNNAGAGVQLKLNKNAIGDTASFLFQTGFSGRAEIGLTGNDDFSFKVSPDGSTFKDGIVIDKTTGKVRFPSGARSIRRVDLGGRFYMNVDNRWITFSTNYGIASENHSSSMGTASEPNTSHLGIGIYLRQGETLVDLHTAWRCNASDVTNVDVRMLFHTGLFDGTWNTAAETTQSVIHSEDGVPMTVGWSQYKPSVTEFTAPADGFFMLVIRPVGTLTATRYIYTNGSFTILTE